MADTTWNSSGSTDGNLASNWTNGAPAADKTLVFDGTSNVTCTFSANFSCGGISVAGGHSGIVDFNGKTVTIGTLGFVADGGTVEMGVANFTCAGDWDVENANDFNPADSYSGSLTLTGSGVTYAGFSSHGPDNLAIGSSASVTCSTTLRAGKTLTMSGSAQLTLHNSPNIVYGVLDLSGGTILSGGASCVLQLQGPTFGGGILNLGADLSDLPVLQINHSYSGATYAPGTIDCDVEIFAWGSGSKLYLAAGTHTFTKKLTLRSSSTAKVPAINGAASATVELIVADLEFEFNDSANIALDFTDSTVNLTVTGDVYSIGAGSGTLVVTPGNGILTFSGDNDQSVDFADQALGTIGGACEIEKTGGTLTFTGGLSTGTMTVYSGSDVVFGSNTIAVNYLDVQSGSSVDPGGTTLSASNDVDFDDQDFSSASPWTVNGTNLRFKKCDVANCFASGVIGSATADRRSRDKGGNFGVTFATYITPGNSMLTGVG